MRRGFILITVSVLLICLLAGTQSAAAQLLAGVQLSYGWANYADILGKGSARASQLLTSVWGQYDHEDLRFTGSYLGSLSLGGKSVSQNLGQLAANYRLLEEGPMQIYVGLGYHLLSTRFDGELGGMASWAGRVGISPSPGTALPARWCWTLNWPPRCAAAPC